MQSKCRRLLYFNNISKNETIIFVWQLKPLDLGEVRVSCVHRIRTFTRAPEISHTISSHLVLSHPCEAPETLSPNQQVSVSPVRGKVAPEEMVPFVVTLQASVHASFYSIDLVCKVGSAPKRSGMEYSSPSWVAGWAVKSPDSQRARP